MSDDYYDILKEAMRIYWEEGRNALDYHLNFYVDWGAISGAEASEIQEEVLGFDWCW